MLKKIIIVLFILILIAACRRDIISKPDQIINESDADKYLSLINATLKNTTIIQIPNITIQNASIATTNAATYFSQGENCKIDLSICKPYEKAEQWKKETGLKGKINKQYCSVDFVTSTINYSQAWPINQTTNWWCGKVIKQNIIINETCGNNICEGNEFTACINDCLLPVQEYKFGIIYVYNSNETYSQDWKTEINAITPKIENTLRNFSNKRIMPNFSIIGEYKSDELCWNPSRIGIITNYTAVTIYDYNTSAQQTNSNYSQIRYYKLPNSDFTSLFINNVSTTFENYGEYINNNTKVYNKITEKIISNTCTNCIVENVSEYYPTINKSVNLTKISMDCKNKSLITQNRLNNLLTQLEDKFNFKKEDYYKIILIFGKLGPVLPDQEIENKLSICKGTSLGGGGTDAGAGKNIIRVGENFILWQGYVNCTGITSYPQTNNIVFSQFTGWDGLIHEILHMFGALDLYNIGMSTSQERTERKRIQDKALSLDPLSNRSIMWNGFSYCMEYGNNCTINDLDSPYIDSYTKQLIGVE